MLLRACRVTHLLFFKKIIYKQIIFLHITLFYNVSLVITNMKKQTKFLLKDISNNMQSELHKSVTAPNNTESKIRITGAHMMRMINDVQILDNQHQLPVDIALPNHLPNAGYKRIGASKVQRHSLWQRHSRLQT